MCGKHPGLIRDNKDSLPPVAEDNFLGGRRENFCEKRERNSLWEECKRESRRVCFLQILVLCCGRYLTSNSD